MPVSGVVCRQSPHVQSQFTVAGVTGSRASLTSVTRAHEVKGRIAFGLAEKTAEQYVALVGINGRVARWTCTVERPFRCLHPTQDRRMKSCLVAGHGKIATEAIKVCDPREQPCYRNHRPTGEEKDCGNEALQLTGPVKCDCPSHSVFGVLGAPPLLRPANRSSQLIC